MMNLGVGPGGALGVRAKDAQRGMGSDLFADRMESSSATSAQHAAPARGTRKFEDQLEETLALARDDDKDEPIAVVEPLRPMPAAAADHRQASSQTTRRDAHAADSSECSRNENSDAATTPSESATSSVASGDDGGQPADDPANEALADGQIPIVPNVAPVEASIAQSTKAATPPVAGAADRQPTEEPPAILEAVSSNAVPQTAESTGAAAAPAIQPEDAARVRAAAPDAPTLVEAEGKMAADAKATVATDTAFEQLTDDRDDNASDGERPADRHAKSVERIESRETFRPAVATETHSAAAESRTAGLSGLAAVSLPRLAEFEGARAGAAAASAALPDADTPDRIVQSLRLQFQRGGGDAIVHIKPEHLGPLTISLRVENGTVSAHVTADNPVTAEWLQSNEQTLRDGLKSNGLQLDRLVVNRDADPSGRPPHREESQRQREQRRRFNERQSTFEITV